MQSGGAYVSDALNASWRINVGGRVYGPYSGHQIKTFALEGRVAPHSIVQSGEQGPWITAIDDPVLAQLFVAPSRPEAARPLGAATEQAKAVEPNTAAANFVVIADLRSRGSQGFEAAMARIGESYRLNPLVWLVHSEKSAGTIRNELIQHLGQSDTLFVVDAARSKTAWYNLGPEADAKIRKVWRRNPERPQG